MAVSRIIDYELPPREPVVRVLTHNIYGRSADWEARRRVLIDGLRRLGPDLVTFQESVLTGDYDQPRDLLGTDYEIVHSEARGKDGAGITIASRWPITLVRELDLNLTPRSGGDYASTTLIAETQAPHLPEPLLLVNHFPDAHADHAHERELQTVFVARAIEAMVAERNCHVVLAGDLNAEPDAASVRFLTGKQSLDGLSVCYRDAWESAHPGQPAPTYSARNSLQATHNWNWPFQQIDHILVRCGVRDQPTLHIAACDLAFAEPVNGVWASDHFGLVTELMPPGQAPDSQRQTAGDR